MKWFTNFFKSWQEVFTYREVVRNFVITNLKMRYKRSFLGFIWTLLNPLMMMAVTSVVFSMLFRHNLKNFALYIFSGLVPWGFISAAAINGSLAIVHNEGYIKKIYIPKLVFPVNVLTTEMVNTLLALMSLFLLGFFLHLKISIEILLLPYAFLTLFIFILGLSLVLSVMMVYFRDLNHIVQISFNAFFYLCPIIYPISFIPPKYQHFFDYNPFNYYITMFRDAIYYNRWSEPRILYTSAIIALVSLLIGYIVFKRGEKHLVYRL